MMKDAHLDRVILVKPSLYNSDWHWWVSESQSGKPKKSPAFSPQVTLHFEVT